MAELLKHYKIACHLLNSDDVKKESFKNILTITNILKYIKLCCALNDSSYTEILKLKGDNEEYEKILSLYKEWQKSKHNCLHKLVKIIKILAKLVDKFKKYEQKHLKDNIEIDEKEFQDFSEKQLAKDDASKAEKYKTNNFTPQTPITNAYHKKKFKIPATSMPKNKSKKEEIFEMYKANEDGMVEIGPNGTMITETALRNINWSLSGTAITRKILVAVFGRETLASHNLTGKPSPAFLDCGKPLKNRLNESKVADIINFVMQITGLTQKEVRCAITTKCADENKMLRLREKKKANNTKKKTKKGA